MAKTERKGLDISAKSFIGAIVIIFALMCLTYVATFLIPGGEYARVTDANGMETIVTDSFKYVDGGVPFFKWVLSPFLVLGADGGGAIIAVIVFLLVIGGIFTALDKCGLMEYMLKKIVHKFGQQRYTLMALVMLFFMSMGAFIGSLEECVPLVPIVVGLAVALGWDELTGLGMSILAVGCGFAAGVCNPFTVGVAQELAGLPMFSGIWLRAFSFAIIYCFLMLFLFTHVKKIEKPMDEEYLRQFSNSSVKEIAYSSGSRMWKLVITFKDGVISVLPGVLLILMANSIRFTLMEGNILNTILEAAVTFASGMPRWGVLLFIYGLVLFLNFFIPSGSAKAFLLMPLIVPTAEAFGISAQLCVMAFAFGDGFSNVFYPTNPVLLISLGLANVSYGTWVKWSGKFQLLNLLVTSTLLFFGMAVGYC